VAAVIAIEEVKVGDYVNAGVVHGRVTGKLVTGTYAVLYVKDVFPAAIRYALGREVEVCAR
jgi:hypothetical protein